MGLEVQRSKTPMNEATRSADVKNKGKMFQPPSENISFAPHFGSINIKHLICKWYV